MIACLCHAVGIHQLRGLSIKCIHIGIYRIQPHDGIPVWGVKLYQDLSRLPLDRLRAVGAVVCSRTVGWWL